MIPTKDSHHRLIRSAATAAALISIMWQPALAAESATPTTASASQPAESQPAESEAAKPPRKPFTSKAFGARLAPEPPDYVRTLSTTGLPGTEDLNWLDFGLEHRTRWEYRDDDYRRPQPQRDTQFLLRTRGYVGIREILDPFRFGFEFMDARQFGSQFPDSTNDINHAEILQAFGELYFKDAFGPRQPLRFQAGRMTLDLIDRKVIGLQRWRNVQQPFDGFRIRIGEATSDWELNVIAVQPVERFMRSFDHGDDERWLLGATGAWRKWDQYVTLQPYYFVLDEDRKGPTSLDREIHTMGLHAFGPIADTGFDYDTDIAFQFGDDGPRNHCAFAAYGELGYTFKHEWKPRVSFSTSYGSGDRNPNDNTSDRFDRMFAPNHYRSMLDYWSWQNVINPKMRIEFQPLKQLRADAAYGAYWLASDSDAWVTPGRRDRQGESGDFVGQEIELRLRYEIDPRINVETGYAHFFPGPFVRNTGTSKDSDLFYVQVTFKLFK